MDQRVKDQRSSELRKFDRMIAAALRENAELIRRSKELLEQSKDLNPRTDRD